MYFNQLCKASALTKRRNWLVTFWIFQLTFIKADSVQLKRLILISNLGAHTTKYQIKNNSLVQNMQPENLTGNGLRQHLIIGLQLKKKYSEFVEKADQKQVGVWSSSVAGSSQAVTALLQGIWGEGSGAKLEDKTYINPPIRNFSETFDSDFGVPSGLGFLSFNQTIRMLDTLFVPDLTQACPEASKLLTKKFTEESDPISGALSFLSSAIETAGLSSRKLFSHGTFSEDDVSSLGQALSSCSAEEGPSCKLYSVNLEPTTAETLKRFPLYREYLRGQTAPGRVYTHRLGQLLLGLLSEQWPTIGVVLGTDNTVMHLTRGLGVLGLHCLQHWYRLEQTPSDCVQVPSTASLLSLEVWEDSNNGQSTVKASLDNTPIQICGQQDCSVDELRAKIREGMLFQGDFEATCGNVYYLDKGHHSGQTSNLKVWLLGSLLAVSTVALLLQSIAMKCRRKLTSPTD